MLINEEGKFRKIISKEKEMLSKTTKRNYKWDLIQHLNHQVQHNQRNIKIRDTQTAIIQTRMKVMTNLTTSSQKTSSATTTNLTKKRLSPKMNLSPYTLPILQLSLLSPYLVYQSLLQQQNLTISFLKTIQKIQRHIQDSN